RRERAGGDAPAPELAPHPVADLAPALDPEQYDVARHGTVELDRAVDAARIPQDRTPMRHERVALPRREHGHAVGGRVSLVLVEDREVVHGDGAEPYLAD